MTKKLLIGGIIFLAVITLVSFFSAWSAHKKTGKVLGAHISMVTSGDCGDAITCDSSGILQPNNFQDNSGTDNHSDSNSNSDSSSSSQPVNSQLTLNGVLFAKGVSTGPCKANGLNDASSSITLHPGDVICEYIRVINHSGKKIFGVRVSHKSDSNVQFSLEDRSVSSIASEAYTDVNFIGSVRTNASAHTFVDNTQVAVSLINTTPVNLSGVVGTQMTIGDSTDNSGKDNSGSGNSNGSGNSTPCVINSFTASPNPVIAGQSAVLSWDTANCNSLVIKNDGNGKTLPVDPSGSIKTVAINSTARYSLNGNGQNSNTNQDVTIDVTQPTVSSGDQLCKIISFTASPAAVDSGKSSLLQWVATDGCDQVIISNKSTGQSKPVDNSSSIQTNPITAPTTYMLTAKSSGHGDLTRVVTVSVTKNNNSDNSGSGNSNGNGSGNNNGSGSSPSSAACQINSFTAANSVVSANGSTTLSWSTSGCDNVALQQIPAGQNSDSGSSVDTSGNISTGSIAQTTVFVLKASKGSSTVVDGVIIRIPSRKIAPSGVLSR